jgi:hypothetical protein
MIAGFDDHVGIEACERIFKSMSGKLHIREDMHLLRMSHRAESFAAQDINRTNRN